MYDFLNNLKEPDIHETDDMAAQRVASAVVAMCLCVRYKITYTHQDFTRPLFMALRIRPLKDGVECEEYKRLVEVHFLPPHQWYA